MKCIYRANNGKNMARVYKNIEWDEYVVRYYANGKLVPESDYFTDNRHDAIGTAHAMLTGKAA